MKKLSLKSVSPGSHSLCPDKEYAELRISELQTKMFELLYLMFAHNRYSLLIILQGIDAAGKDGAIQHIFAGANPQAVRVASFKEPTDEENRHDFLWRCHRHTPESGSTMIFNRSYYEEVTTSLVHPEYLENQHIPDEFLKRSDFFERRYQRINDFEKALHQNGTLILKFLLHISKEEQESRLQERLHDPRKNWKFSPSDLRERKYWNQYMKAFDQMLKATHTKHAPWTIVPANHKWYRNFLISKKIVESLDSLDMSFPKNNSRKK